MRRGFAARKNAILGGTLLLVLADFALAAYSSQLASAPQLTQPSLRLMVLQNDIEKAQKIREEMPKTKDDCEKFEKSLFPASSGYSAVSSELAALARKSGTQLEDLTFKATQVPNRGMTEVAADLTVSGDYKNVIQFLNGVQRSTHHQIDALTLGTENTNQRSAANVIKVSLHLRTYFRVGS